MNRIINLYIRLYLTVYCLYKYKNLFYQKLLQRMTRTIHINILIKQNDLVGDQSWTNGNSRSNENL